MVKFHFKGPPVGDAADLSAECERQLLPVIREIVQSAEAAGWNRKDVLLVIVELAWEFYETGRTDL
ncbi:hypothetical protein [Nitratireductor luteus]|uniref:hypothetical protein n=1 Tax=Nitratireductor luteus TaxID=2976980 RepID=UPI00223ECD68|nr:hypothetical protein [Nitratireductor luteus]